MTFQFVPAASLYILSAIVVFTLAVVTWRMKPERGATWIMLLVCAGIWAAGSALETFVPDLETKVRIITTIPYIGITGVVYFWTLFTIIYSHHEHWLNKYTVTLLAVMPAITYLMVFTADAHHLIWASYWLEQMNGLGFFNQEYGVWFWVWGVYAYLAILAGAVLVITAVIRSPRLYQGQALMLVLGVLTPLISNFLYLVGFNPIKPLDLSPIAITLSGIFITIGLLRFQLFNLAPVAHDLVFKGVTSGVIIIDLKGHVIDVNPAAEQILRRSRNDVVGQDIRISLPDYTDLMQQFEHTWEATTEIALAPGPREYDMHIMPLTSRSGRLAGRIILLYDITERKQALAERDKLISELDAYAHTVAHDLKNPMSLITGYSNLMLRKEKGTLSESGQASLQVIAKTGNKMAEIVDALLLLASVRSMEAVEIKPLDTAVLVQNAWNRLTGSQEAAAELVLPENWPTAVGYAPWVEQVWVNYLSNAIKYGGQPPSVVVGAEIMTKAGNGARPSVRFWVRDDGKGLSVEEATKLFQQFARLDQHTAVQGHGLGLSIVQRIVEKLDGSVGVESEPGVGSTFYFTLPMADTAVAAMAETATSEAAPLLPHDT